MGSGFFLGGVTLYQSKMDHVMSGDFTKCVLKCKGNTITEFKLIKCFLNNYSF